MKPHWRAAFLGAATVICIIGTRAVGDDSPFAIRPAAAQEAEELDPDDMEAALAAEQARQDALQALQDQLSEPFALFDQAYEATIAERQEAAAQLVAAVLNPDGCNFSSLEQVQYAPDQFVTSEALKKGKAELEELRANLANQDKPVEVQVPSGEPPVVSESVIDEIKATLEEIEPLSAEYERSCVEQERVSQLPPSQAAEIMAAASKLQNEQAELSGRVEQLVADMNGRIDAVDQALVDWLATPLRNARTAE